MPHQETTNAVKSSIPECMQLRVLVFHSGGMESPIRKHGGAAAGKHWLTTWTPDHTFLLWRR